MSEKHHVLLAMDRSDQSLATIQYLAGVLSPQKTCITMFHVKPDIPKTFLDQENYVEDESFKQFVHEWSDLLALDIDKFMDKGAKIFFEAGFDRSSVETVIEPRKTGYARDILEKSHQGYDALVFGRRGFILKGGMMGSVASKLVETVKHIPIAVVGGQPETGNCFIAFDKSQNAMKGVEWVSTLFDISKIHVYLCHVIRPLNISAPGVPQFFQKSYENNWIYINKQKIAPVMADAGQILMQKGLDASNFSTIIRKEPTSRAEALYSEMNKCNAGTMVLGRHGLSMANEFSVGTITRKILHLALDKAVWVI